MSLLRLAQKTEKVPRQSIGQTFSGTSTPNGTPRNRPRPSLGVQHSPAATASRTHTIPFDWDAARSLKPAPYATPVRRRTQERHSTLDGDGTPKRERVVRQKTFWERLQELPSQADSKYDEFLDSIWPSDRKCAIALGGVCHILHLIVTAKQSGESTDSTYIGWEDMYHEDQTTSWFDWTSLLTFLLISGSCLNALYLFSRIKEYRLHRQYDPVASPNAKYVDAEVETMPEDPPSLITRIVSGTVHMFLMFCKFLFGIKTTKPPQTAQALRVQQLDVWNPGELELTAFCIYSPVHSLLWMAMGSMNWMLMILIMGVVSAQLHFIILAFQRLLKDRQIISSEVMNEYNLGFVYPRTNPYRRDVAVMTHQSEMVNVWED